MIEIDGSYGEGGGQILRTSLTLSLVTGKAFHLRAIRAGRSRPGLQPQHLTSVRAAAAVSKAQTRGSSLGSTDLTFEPGEVKGGNYEFVIGTAGATGLVLQTIYLPLALRAKERSDLVLVGGTHVRMSPCFNFLDTTWRAYLARMGIYLMMTMVRPGFYPRGGGEVHVGVELCTKIRALNLCERVPPTAVAGFSAAADLPEHIIQRQARQARNRLRDLGFNADIREEAWNGGPGTVLAVTLDTRPVPTLFFGLGALGKPAEHVADEAIDQVAAYVHAASGAIDPHSADQLVLPLALAEGPSEFTVSEVTSHLLTNIDVIRMFIDREIVCKEIEGAPGKVSIP